LQVTTLVILFFVGRYAELGAWYQLGVVGAAALAAWQQYLIRDREPDACFRAFLNNNLFGLSIFAGVVLSFVLGNG
jgi:4-hydroxybenzoate polyprenyltransferase